MRSSRFLVAAAAAAILASPNLAQNPDRVVIEAGRIITQAGADIENGVIVIENGRIAAIGPAADVEKPWDAPVLGGPDLVAFPGFVEAHTSSGMDRANENIDVAPFLDIRDSVDPIAYYFEDCVRWGITTVNVQQGDQCVIGGRGMIVRPVGMTVEEMALRPTWGIKMSAAPKRGKSGATQAQALRRAFTDLRSYLEDLVASEQQDRGKAKREALFQGRELDGDKDEGRAMGGTAWKVDGLEIIPRGAIDEKQAPLLDVVEGRYTVFIACDYPREVPIALEVARDNGFLARTVLVLQEGCWKAADAIAEAGVPVVLDGDLIDTERDPITGEETETFVPGVFQEKGVTYALSSRNASTNSLWFQAALASGQGLTREQALASVTTTPATMLGIGEEVGTLEAGKLGNVVLFSGDPMSITSWVEYVVIEGNEVYDRSKDVRNTHLLDGTPPAGTAPADDESDDDESEEEEDEGDGEDEKEKE